MSSTIEQIKSRLGIVDVVGTYLRLQKAGANMKAKCPFHTERTPSFFVSPARETYHCFGCNRGGDIFTFVEEIEGVDFIEALKMLAVRAGVEVVRENPKLKSERDALYAIHEKATRFYRKELARAPEAVAYLKDRGLSKETILSWEIGFAPPGWRNLYEALRGSFRDDQLASAGVIIQQEKGEGGKKRPYDRFRGRIMFPLRDHQGRTVAFSGRVFGKDESEAKYINSPQTPIYDKSALLYGYDRAKEAMRKSGACILVEGQMDVLMAHQAGSANTVATSGTALTARHIERIARLADELVAAFDHDEAGTQALMRTAELALPQGLSVRAVGLSGAKDPAEMIKEDPAHWQAAVDEAEHAILFLVRCFEERDMRDRELVLAVQKYVIPLLARLESKMEQSHFVRELAGRIAVGEGAIFADMRKIVAGQQSPARQESGQQTPPARRKDAIMDRILGIRLWATGKEKSADLGKEIEERFHAITGADIAERERAHEPHTKARLSFEADVSYEEADDARRDLDELFLNLEEEFLKERFAGAMMRLREAERDGKEEGVEKELKECKRLSDALTDLRSKKDA